jgi:hypothetical protein
MDSSIAYISNPIRRDRQLRSYGATKTIRRGETKEGGKSRQASVPCVCRKLKFGRSGGEARQGWRVILFVSDSRNQTRNRHILVQGPMRSEVIIIIPLIIIMIVALVSTKLPILLGHDVWLFHLAQDIKRTGFWSVMHEARTDLTMLLGASFC